MLEFYPQILAVHVTAVILTGVIFFSRTICALFDQAWPRAFVVRMTSYVVDSVLLTAAVLLWTILPPEMFASHWLTVKLVLVVTYIGLGITAMRERLGRPVRMAALAGTALAYVTIIGIALNHSPLSWFAG